MRSLIAFSLSVMGVSFLPFLLEPWWLLVCCLMITSLVVKFKRYRYLSIVLGIVYATGSAYTLIDKQLPDTLDGADVLVKGQVVGLPVVKTGSVRFDFKVMDATLYDENEPLTDFLPGKQLSISYSRRYNYQYPMSMEAFVPGRFFQLRLKLRKPRGFVNPVGFDYHLYLLRKKVSATAYIKSDSKNILLDVNQASSLTMRRDQLRFKLRDFVERNTPEDSIVAGSLLALMTGDKQLIQSEQWQLFKDTGTIHLMVISGLHIGLIAFLGFYIGRFLVNCSAIVLSRSGFFSLNVLNAIPPVFSMFFASTYAFMAGFGLPTQRALVMVCFFQIAYFLRMQSQPWLAFCAALAFVLLIDPLAAHTVGFWLSFGAVAILLFSFRAYVHSANLGLLKRTLRQWLKSQWVLLIGLSVPSIVLLDGFSLSGFVSNFIAIPVVSFLIVPLVLLSAILFLLFESVAIFFFELAQISFELLLRCLLLINQYLPSFYTYQNTLSSLSIIVGVFGACYFLAPAMAYRYLALLCFLPVIFAAKPAPFLRLTFLDVGQGTAIVVETKNHQMVYDTGKRYSDSFDVGEHILAPYLLSLGQRRINRLVVSHGDSDHAGGVMGLSEQIHSGQVLVGEPKKTVGEQCVAGQAWQWDGVEFEVLWPTKDYLKSVRQQFVPYKSNNVSCVIKITAGSHVVILAGDIEKSIESQLVQSVIQAGQQADIVLAPHHGSKTSSSVGWVNGLQAKYAVFSAGYRNSYGHPHKDVVRRYQQAKTITLNTANDGAIRFTLHSPQEQWTLERWRYDHARYWY